MGDSMNSNLLNKFLSMKSRRIFFTSFILSLIAVSFTGSFAANSSNYQAEFEVTGFGTQGDINSANYNASISGAALGGSANSSSYSVIFGILARVIDTTTSTTTTTTLPPGGLPSGSVSISAVNGKASSIFVESNTSVSLKNFLETPIIEIYFNSKLQIIGGTVEVLPIAKDEISNISGLPKKEEFAFVNITKLNMGDDSIGDVKIKFFVNKSFLEEKNVSREQVVLERFDVEWKVLPTQFNSDDDSKVYFVADSPGFSYFAITLLPEPPATTTTLAETTTTTSAGGEKQVSYGLEIVAAIAIILILIYFVKKRFLNRQEK